MKKTEGNEKIRSFLEQKITLFDRYMDITTRMKEAFRDGEAVELGGFISQRQDCIKRIERIDAALKGMGENQRGFIGRYSEKLKGIMETVDLMDRELMGMAKEESDSVKTELLKIRGGRQAAQGYKRGVSHTPRFLDVRS